MLPKIRTSGLNRKHIGNDPAKTTQTDAPEILREFKAKVALEAIKAQETINQIATRYEVHPHQVTQWKQQLLQQAPAAFEQPAALSQAEGVEEELYAQIGRLKMQLEWLKKSWDHICLEQCRSMIAEHPQLSLRQQCGLLGLHCSGLYSEIPGAEDTWQTTFLFPSVPVLLKAKAVLFPERDDW